MKHFFTSWPVMLAVIVVVIVALGATFRFIVVDTPLEVQATDNDADDMPLEFHYNAVSSSILSPEAARLYGIKRDGRIGVAVVSVYQKDAPGVGVRAQVNGTKTNLSQQMDTLSFDEIREGQAIYYVSTFSFTPEEHLTFEVDVEVAQTGETRELKWRQQFW